MLRSALRIAILLALPAPALAAGATATGSGGLRLIGEQVLPKGLDVAGTRVGGLSGLAFDETNGRWLALSDDRSENAPARFYELALAYDATAFRGAAVTGVVTLSAAAGKPFPTGTIDPEALRLTGNGDLYWTSEGDARAGFSPSLNASKPDGRFLRGFSLPARYHNGDGTHGPRDNLAFEGLAIAPDGKTLILALENALIEDGPKASLEAGSPVRIATIDAASGEPGPEWVYVTDPIRQAPAKPGGFADNGISEILPLGNDALLVLERGYVQGRGNSIRLYRAETAGATDVSHLDHLAGTAWQPLRKTLVLDLAGLDVKLDNFEGMDWGPGLPNGHRSLVLVSDDNFNDSQVTKFLVFEVTDPALAP
ncbi:esterase-like activity of phytase family protein [Chelatococcus sp. GCM10030263]|uniref:esterase-like activity of phytase family protein n=1 Tax=Chelatococcus sp. GCM10030263 TaxID=3273387 RepID=UPI003607D8E4